MDDVNLESASTNEKGASGTEATAERSEKPITLLDLKSNYIYLPRAFFEQRLSPLQFGHSVLQWLKVFGHSVFAAPSQNSENYVPVLGYVFCGSLSPVEIAVYASLCANGSVLPADLAKTRKLPVKLVKRTIAALVELGVIVEKKWGSDVSYVSAKLEDVLG